MTKDGNTYWIIGAGRFGAKAVERLAGKHPESEFVVVDESREALETLRQLPVQPVCEEGAAYLATRLDGGIPDWIIPAVPIHLAFEWVRMKMAVMGRPLKILPVPSAIEGLLPNPVRGREGQVFISYADFVCPDNCSEPFDRCTFTGKPRKGLLYQVLERIVFEDFLSVVICSRQLVPGVGGYRPEALKEALAKVEAHNGPVLFSTACLCHGVMHAMSIQS